MGMDDCNKHGVLDDAISRFEIETEVEMVLNDNDSTDENQTNEEIDYEEWLKRELAELSYKGLSKLALKKMCKMKAYSRDGMWSLNNWVTTTSTFFFFF